MLLITNQLFGLVGLVRLPLRLRILSRELSGHLPFFLEVISMFSLPQSRNIFFNIPYTTHYPET